MKFSPSAFLRQLGGGNAGVYGRHHADGALFAREGVNLETSREAVRATAVRPCVAESDNEQSQEALHFQRVLQAL